MIFKKYTNRFKHDFIVESSVLDSFYAMRDGLDAAGIDIDIAQGWRGQKEQDEAKANGLSNASFGHSPHNFGVAFDICCALKGQALGWPKDDALWAKIGEAGKYAGLVWGGDFKSIHDTDHFELPDWQKQNLTLYAEEPPLG